MLIAKWFLWRRWRLKSWVGPYYYPDLITDAHNLNFGGCRKHRIIYLDLVNIINANRPG